MVLYRRLARNLSRRRVESLKDAIHLRLEPLDPEFPWGMIGTTIVPVRYVTLPVHGDEQLGYQLMISFWAWGSSDAELLGHLNRVMKNLSQGLRTSR
jgi:hypothetical protein